MQLLGVSISRGANNHEISIQSLSKGLYTMSPSISEQLEPIVKSLSKFLWRFHVIIYSVVVIGGVAIAIFLLSGLLAVPTEEPQTASISFDKNHANY